MNPEITVLMSVYNEEKFLCESIESILGQTFLDFEFLIINDGSSDKSPTIIQSYQKQDSRIRIIHNPDNIGLTQSLNAGLQSAKGTYIARMDGDDVSLPERLAKQYQFMSRNQDVGICGTWLRTIGEKHGVWKPPIEDASIRATMIFENVMYHPTVMFRRSLFKERKLYFNQLYLCAQDYELWSRCSAHTQFANLDDVLLERRLHSSAVGSVHIMQQQDVASKVRLFYLYKLGITPSEEEADLHNDIASWHFNCDRKFVLATEKWLLKLQAANKRTAYLSEVAFSQILAERWFRVCRYAQGLGFWTWKTFKQSTLSNFITLQLLNEIGFGTKCLLRI